MKFNPATLPEDEINSGKIWTLLQFNDDFEKDVDWFSEKYQRIKSKRVKQENQVKALSDCYNKLEEINNKNSFAGTALQWMFPNPNFWKENGKEVTAHAFSWGPEIWLEKENRVKWEEYETSKNWLTLKTDWPSINEGFKDAFMFQYRQIDSRAVHPISKNRNDSSFPHETDFFEGWDLVDAIKQISDLSEEDLATKSMSFKTLQKQYRVLAIPRHLHTKKAVDDAFKPLIKQFKADLPKNASDPFGTKTEWKDYLAVREIQEDGSIPSKAKAIKTLIEKRHCKDRQFLVDGVFRLSDARRVYEGDITNNCKEMASKINSVYPDLLL